MNDNPTTTDSTAPDDWKERAERLGFGDDLAALAWTEYLMRSKMGEQAYAERMAAEAPKRPNKADDAQTDTDTRGCCGKCAPEPSMPGRQRIDEARTEECDDAMRTLDALEVPREQGGGTLTLSDRIAALANRGMTRRVPIVDVIPEHDWRAHYGDTNRLQRAADLERAINRYRLSGFEPKPEWIAELRRLSLTGFAGEL